MITETATNGVEHTPDQGDTPVAVGWRIRIEGDSFAILPPEVER